MYKRALVPLDGSLVAEAIIPFLVKIAGPLDMSILLVRVLEPIPRLAGDGVSAALLDDETRTRDAAEYLAPLAASLRARGVDASWAVRRGQPADAIVEAAREAGADLIAMSTHGRSGLGRLLFGSVAEQVLRQADVPVFMMRQTEARLAAPGAVEHAVQRFAVPGPRGRRTL
ncbi:MAG TPA: universal stress protein [Methylomirabilota bacterium]|nr:universal stress protein [Methylomirabilota bacterium]